MPCSHLILDGPLLLLLPPIPPSIRVFCNESTLLMRWQRFLHNLAETQEVPRHTVSTPEEARGSRPHPEEPRFCLGPRDDGSFPCLVGKEFPAFPSHLKRRRSPQERRAELQGRTTIPRVPQMSQSIPGKPVFPALPRLSS